jgi:hypothetical protein
MIINNLRVPVTKLREGDLFVAVHNPAARGWASYGVVAEVREVSHWEDEYTVRYSVTDKPSGMCYGSDQTYRRGDKVTLITITN